MTPSSQSSAQPSGTIRLRPDRGYSVHLGGPWYVQSWPNCGAVTYAKDHGTGIHAVGASVVPLAVRLRAEGQLAS